MRPDFAAAPDTLEHVARHGPLPGGWQAHYLPSTASTQQDARRGAAEGTPTRTVWVADFQTAGRGRQGRSWQSPAGTALMLSALFRVGSWRPEPLRYTMLLSVALSDAIESCAPGVRIQVKWPNDLMLNGRKLAGVLAEALWEGRDLTLIVGAGINVTVTEEQLGPVASTATSLFREGVVVDRGVLLAQLLQQLDAWDALPLEDLRAAWKQRLWGRGQTIRLREPLSSGELEQSVVILGVTPEGALRVLLPGGGEHTTTTAELIL